MGSLALNFRRALKAAALQMLRSPSMLEKKKTRDGRLIADVQMNGWMDRWISGRTDGRKEGRAG